MTFTADNLPDAARGRDFCIKVGAAHAVRVNDHVAQALNNLDAAHGGRLSALLNGTAPAFTDEPPDVTWGDVDAVGKVYESNHPGHKDGLMLALKADRARVWQTHRPKPVDAVRFALEKVDRSELQDALNGSITLDDLLDNLARILPVAETKQWAELTDEEGFQIVRTAYQAWRDAGSDTCVTAAATVLRASLSAYAPPPRNIRVTPEVMEVFGHIWGVTSNYRSTEPGFEDFRQCDLEGVRAAFDHADSQAEARESEAVAEVVLLKGEIERLEAKDRDADIAFKHMNDQIARLTKERDEAQAIPVHNAKKLVNLCEELAALQTHAAKLEAMLTVPGVDGPVKTWEDFECRYVPRHIVDHAFCSWKKAKLVLWYVASPRLAGPLSSNDVELRQTPAPEAELKRWKIANADEFTDDVEYFVSKPMTRADAEKRGKVFGEA